MFRSLPTLALLGAFVSPALSAEPADWKPPTAVELAAREKIRGSFEEIVAYLGGDGTTDSPDWRFRRGVRRIVALGPDVVPFLRAEIELPTATTFNVACYALGLLRAPESAEILRKAADVAAAEHTPFGDARQFWAEIGLAVAGEPEAIDRLLQDDATFGKAEHFPGIEDLGVAALLLEPGAVDLLVRRLDSVAGTPPTDDQIEGILCALGRLRDARGVERVGAYLASPSKAVRSAAAFALARIAAPSSAPTLLHAAQDPDPLVASPAAWGAWRTRALSPEEITAALDGTSVPMARGWLYHALADAPGEKALLALLERWRSTTSEDRAMFVLAVAGRRDRRAINFLRLASRSAEIEALRAAVDGLRAMPSEGANDTLLAFVQDPRWVAARFAIDDLVAMGDVRAAPRIAGRLFAGPLSGPLTDYSLVSSVHVMLEALVSLGYTAPIEDLRASAKIQPDAGVAAAITKAADLLERIRANGDDPEKWGRSLAEATEDEDRRLAVDHLARIGGDAAAAKLSAAYDAASPAIREAILTEGARRRLSGLLPLFLRVLADPAGDADEDAGPARAAAAWGALRTGGDRGAEAIRAAAARTDGREIALLWYLAAARGKDALPTIEKLRLSRVRWFFGPFGEEQSVLDDMVTTIRNGADRSRLDVPPDEIQDD